MTPEIVVDVFSQAFALVIMLTGTIVLPGLIVGLIIAIFQAVKLAGALNAKLIIM